MCLRSRGPAAASRILVSAPARQPDLVRASRKSGGGAAEGSIANETSAVLIRLAKQCSRRLLLGDKIGRFRRRVIVLVARLATEFVVKTELRRSLSPRSPSSVCRRLSDTWEWTAHSHRACVGGLSNSHTHTFQPNVNSPLQIS